MGGGGDDVDAFLTLSACRRFLLVCSASCPPTTCWRSWPHDGRYGGEGMEGRGGRKGKERTDNIMSHVCMCVCACVGNGCVGQNTCPEVHCERASDWGEGGYVP